MLTPSMLRIRARRLLRLVVVGGILAALVSALVPAQAEAKDFRFTGRGWGHGAGMAQWGARGLAEKGKSASQILKHYYSKTAVEKKTLPSTIRVGLLQERNEIWIEGDGRFDLYDRAGTRRASGGEGERWRVVPNDDRLEVFAPGASKPKFTSGVPVTVRWEQHGTLLKLPQTGYRYKRGRIDIDINSSTGKTRAILIVGFEQYLYGLGEMPSSWHTEAIEAQAIAGRTYALEKVKRLGQSRPVCNCAVYATVADQAYVGVAHETERWVKAVKNTAALVVTYNDKPIQALYSSSSGGYTEHNENVFGGSPLPYLRGVCDPGDYYSGENPHNNWTVTMEDVDVSEHMNDAGRNVGLVSDIDYLKPRGVSGRLTPVKDADSGGVRVEGTLDTARLWGGTFRSILGLKTTLLHHHIAGDIRLRYDAMRCGPGLPTGREFTWRDLDGTRRGRAQNFTKGRLFLSLRLDKVFWVGGVLLADYDRRRSKGQDLGMPTRDEFTIGAGKGAHFERGHIYWAPKTGANAVKGAILTKYLKTGGPKKWGLPTTEEQSAPGGRKQFFKKARIYRTTKHGARVVYGAILAEYVEQGSASGKLGMPISDEYNISIGRKQDFEHGYIKWNSSTKQTGYKITD